MTNTLVKIAKGAVITAGITALSLGVALGGIAIDKSNNPMAYAKPGVVEIKSGDTLSGLCSYEGWTGKEMRAHGVPNWNPNISPGDFVSIPQHPGNSEYELGLTGRAVYDTIDDAKVAQKARWAEYSVK